MTSSWLYCRSVTIDWYIHINTSTNFQPHTNSFGKLARIHASLNNPVIPHTYVTGSKRVNGHRNSAMHTRSDSIQTISSIEIHLSLIVKLSLSVCRSSWAPSQYPKRRLSVRSRKVSKPRDLYLELSNRYEIWQALRQQCCRCACQISKRYDNLKYKSRGFETLRDVTKRRLFGYWDGGPGATHATSHQQQPSLQWRHDMGAMASQITSLTIVYSAVYSGADQRKHQSSASLTFVRGIHRWPVNSPHKGPVMRKVFPFDNVIMLWFDRDYRVKERILSTKHIALHLFKPLI